MKTDRGPRSTGTLKKRIIFLLALFASFVCWPAEASDEEEKNTHVVGIVGGSADLECDVDESKCGKVYFITWTKNVSNEWKRLYLYSDAVTKPLQELANPNRAYFTLEESSAYLRISPLRIEDDGTYKCDVTYVQGKCPSLSFATLVTHAQPSAPSIEKDGKTSSNGSIVGPFYEGASLNLECETFGGKPTPSVSWFKDGEEVDSESHVTVEKNGASSVTSSVKVILERDDLGAKIECHVDNEATDDPLVSWVEIDLRVGPNSLEIEGPTSPLIAGEYMTLICTIEGAKPAANATWFNQSDVLNVTPKTQIQEASDGTFTTISTVEVPVSRHDNQRKFLCKGSNSVLQSKNEAPLLKSWEIQVLFPPAVVMKPVDGMLINESDTAFILCTYEANPDNVSDVEWFHEDHLLAVPTKGKYEQSIQGYPVLTIRNVQRADRGDYSCSLSNAIGRGNASNYAELNVLYTPVVEATISPEDVKEGDSISMFCDLVDGNPQNLHNVRWFREDVLIHDTTLRELVWVGVSRNSSGIYSCEGENDAGWGERSEEKELIVKYLPGPAELIELRPPAKKGHSSYLHCDVDDMGLPPANLYWWEKDGEQLATTTSENYTTDMHKVTTRGNYSCAAYNEDVGLGPRGFAYISVYAPPAFIQDLPTIRGAARDAPFISFDCRVECEPLCDVRWLKDGNSLMNSELYIVRNRIIPEDVLNNRFRSVTSTLQFNMTAWPGRRLDRDRDRANYTCYTTGNTVGEGISSSLQFVVEYAPEAMSLSDSIVQVHEGDVPPNVECEASSWPPSTYLWLRENIVLARDDVLSFNDSVDRDHHGQYICVAENRHGRAQIEMTLEVLYKPECTITESSNEQGDSVLICKADGFPTKINFTWSKDNVTLDDDFDMDSDHDDYSVYVLPDSSERYGMYVCIAINDVGESLPCERMVSGAGLAGWHAEFGDKNILVIAAVIGSIAILFLIAIIIIIFIMRKRRLRSFGSPGKAPLGGGGDSLYQNVSGTPSGPKQNGPHSPESEGNVMYENMPFHRQGPVPSFPSARMRQSLPADFSRAYQNVLYCRQQDNWNHAPQQQQQWNSTEQRRISSGSAKREPCPQHGMLPEVLQHRENGGSTQKCPTQSAVIYADLALQYHRGQPVTKEATKYATLKFTSEAAKAISTGQQ